MRSAEEKSKQLAEQLATCGKCAAMGLKSCKCKAGGGGATDDDDDDDALQSAADGPKHTPTPSESVALHSYLDESEIWAKKSEHVFKLSDEAFTIDIEIEMDPDLDLYKLCIEIKGEDALTHKDELFDSIKDEFNTFMKENDIGLESAELKTQDNKLSAKFDDPEMFKAFTKRLLDKNLIPGPTMETALQNSPGVSQEAESGHGVDHEAQRPLFDPSATPKLTPPGADAEK